MVYFLFSSFLSDKYTFSFTAHMFVPTAPDWCLCFTCITSYTSSSPHLCMPWFPVCILYFPFNVFVIFASVIICRSEKFHHSLGEEVSPEFILLETGLYFISDWVIFYWRLNSISVPSIYTCLQK